MKVSVFKKKWFIGVLLCEFLMLAWLVPARADEKPPEEPKPTASLSTDILSQYVFRGVAFSRDSAVIQPSMTFGYEGFALNIWGNFDTRQKTHNPNLAPKNNDGNPAWNETDVTFSYTRELFKDFSVTAGSVYYSLQNAAYDAFELFGGVSYTLPWFTAGVTAYREVSHTPGWWVQLDLSKSFPISCYEGMALNVGATFGYFILEDSDTVVNLAGDLGDYSEWHSATLQASLTVPVCKYVTVAPKLGLALPLTNAASDFIKGNSFDKEDIHVFGGVNLTASF
jgi:hypothetical protein